MAAARLKVIPSSAGSLGIIFSLASLATWATYVLLVIRLLFALCYQE